MGIGQAHEQNNKLVKIDGGAIGILDNEEALLKWAVSSPIVSDILQHSGQYQFEDESDFHHHEDTSSFEEKFLEDKESFQNAFSEFGNPFLEQEISLVHIVSKLILNNDSSNSVKTAKEIGKQQYELFVNERLVTGTSSLHNNIKKNNLSLFRHKNSIVTSKSKQKIVNLNSDCKLYANLYVASQSRQGNLDNFFAHENHSYPVTLSEYGRLRKCTAKSD